MAKNSDVPGFRKNKGKKARQGMTNNTKYSTRVSSKRFKKKYRGQGR